MVKVLKLFEMNGIPYPGEVMEAMKFPYVWVKISSSKNARYMPEKNTVEIEENLEERS